nr:PREDICTED: tumor necrosis factor receptor superfamily member 12A [Equus przewalskii]
MGEARDWARCARIWPGCRLAPGPAVGAAAPPASFRLLWPILGGALSLALVLGLLSGFLVWRRCRRREKFTTPIEETGGEGCPGVALIQ